jgi:glycosyltransferase involved in cell wall biosynthesis
MKILHLVQQYWPFRCGSARYFQTLSEHLAKRGDEVTVFTTDALENDYFESPAARHIDRLQETHCGVAIRRFRARHLSKKARNRCHDALPFRWVKHLFYLPVVPGLLIASLRRREVDIVHAGVLPYGIILHAAEGIARRSRAPLVITPCLHIGEPGDPRILRIHSDPYQIEILRRADLVLALTPREKKALVSLGVPESSVEVIGYGISPSAIAGGDGRRFRDRRGITGPLVLFLGTRGYDKGTVHVVQAAEALREMGRHCTLVLAGSSSNRDFIEFHAGLAPGPRARVLLLDDIPEEEKKDLLAATDVLALPSRNDAFGLAFLEAWAYGKPVIGADAGGIPDVVSDGRDGFLVPFGDTAALARKIGVLLDDPALAARMGEAGRRKLFAQYTIDRKLRAIEDAYETLAAKKNPGGGKA